MPAADGRLVLDCSLVTGEAYGGARIRLARSPCSPGRASEGRKHTIGLRFFDLLHWGHGVVLLLCAAALVCYWALRWYAFREPLVAPLVLVLVVAVIARVARAVRLSRYFCLLLAALAYPYAPWLIFWWGDYGWWRLLPGDPVWTALLVAGPVLIALVALIIAVRPRRRQTT